MERSTERAQTTAVVLLIVGVLALVAAGIGRETDRATTEARAQAVADLVALAAVGDRPAAEAVARDNHAEVVSITGSDGGRVRVVVRFNDVTATASAQPGDAPG